MRELVTSEHGLDVVPGAAHASTALGGGGSRVDMLLRVSSSRVGQGAGVELVPGASASMGGLHFTVEVGAGPDCVCDTRTENRVQ